MAAPKNEAGLCEVVAQLLEKRSGCGRTDVTWPEKDGSGPPVEMRFRLGDKGIAIEHTLVEPFVGFLQMGQEFGELIEDMEALLSGTLPSPGTYYLTFPIHPTKGRHRRTHAALRASIVAWVREAAAEMHLEWPDRKDRDTSPRGYFGHRDAYVDGLKLRLSRRVHWSESGRHDASLFIARDAGGDIEAQRLERIRIALAKKLPKLADCAIEGDETVLILEDPDMALSNDVLIAEAVETVLKERIDGPDHVFIADTSASDDDWYLTQPVVEGVFSLDRPHVEVKRP